MNVPEYMAHFPEVHSTSVYDLAGGAYQDLDSMLRLVGVDDPADPNTELSQIAEAIVVSENSAYGDITRFVRNAGFGQHHDRMQMVERVDDTREVSSERLEKRISGILEGHRASICYASMITLANALNMHGRVKKVQTIPAQAMGATQPQLAHASQVMATTQFFVDKAFIGDERVGEPTVEFSTSATRVLPNWMKDASSWSDGPVDLMLGFHLEHDSFFVLREWCKARREEGYIPVFAPANIDSGQFSESRKESNLQADILLVRLGDEPDIIPVQMKNVIRSKDLDDYDDRVLLMRAQDLGLVTMRTEAVRDQEGHMRTGVISRVVAGSIAREWNLAYSAKQNAKQRLARFSRDQQPRIATVDRLIAEKRAA